MKLEEAISPAALKKVPRNSKGLIPIRYMEGRSRSPWLVTTYRDGGQKSRSFYRTAPDAVKFWAAHCKIVARHGERALDFNPAAYVEWSDAKAIVGPKHSLVDAAREYIARLGMSSGKKVATSVEDFITAKKDSVSKKHLGDLRRQLDAFAVEFGPKDMDLVEPEEIRGWLIDLSLGARTTAN